MSKSRNRSNDIDSGVDIGISARERRERRHAKRVPPTESLHLDRESSDVSKLGEAAREAVVGLPTEPKMVRSMAFGKVSIFIDDQGQVGMKSGMVYDDVVIPPEAVGVLEDSAVVDGIPFPKGVCVIFGGADTAKTPLLHYVLKRTGGDHIRYGEPLPGYFRSEQAAAAAIMTSDNSIIGLDSLKNLVGRLSGGLMDAGVSRELFPMLSDWSSYFAEHGQTLVTIVNASSSAQRVEDMMVEALKSNVTMIIHAKPDGRLDWVARRGSGLRRRTGQHRIEWAGDGEISRLTGSESRITGRATHHNVAPSVDVGVTGFDSGLQRAVARALANANK